MSEAAFQHRAAQVTARGEERQHAAGSWAPCTWQPCPRSGRLRGVHEVPSLEGSTLLCLQPHARPPWRRRSGVDLLATLRSWRPVLPPSGATPAGEQWWCGPAWGLQRRQRPLPPVLPAKALGASQVQSPGAVRWDLPKACSSGSKPHSAPPTSAEQAPWGAAGCPGWAWVQVAQGVPRARGHFGAFSVPCQGAWGPETLEGSSCRGRIQLGVQDPFCLQEQMDTRGATGVPVSWGRAGQSGGGGVHRCPSNGTETGPWTRLAAPGAWQKPPRHRPAPLCAKQLLPSQARTEPRLPSRHRTGARVRESTGSHLLSSVLSGASWWV